MALERNTSLTELFLDECAVLGTGAACFGPLLERNSTLSTLYLKNNSIDSIGAVKLISGLHRNT